MGFRHVVLGLRTCAAARAREAMAARAQTRSCVRARAFREEARAATSAAVARAQAGAEEARAATSAAVACAMARARSALLKAQRRLESASDMTGRRLHRASDRTVYTILKIAYGDSAPPTPSPSELLALLDDLNEQVKKIKNILSLIVEVLEKFESLSAQKQAAIISILLAPFALLRYVLPDFLLYPVPSAPEPLCPFLGMELPPDTFPAEASLDALVSMSASVGSIIIMTVGGLCILVCMDLYHILIADDVLTHDKPIDSSFVASLVPFSAAKQLKKVALMIIADSLSREEDVASLWELFHLIETIGTETTVDGMKDALGMLASALTRYELKIMMNATQQDVKQVMGTRGAYNVLMMTTRFPRHYY